MGVGTACLCFILRDCRPNTARPSPKFHTRTVQAFLNNATPHKWVPSPFLNSCRYSHTLACVAMQTFKSKQEYEHEIENICYLTITSLRLAANLPA